MSTPDKSHAELNINLCYIEKQLILLNKKHINQSIIAREMLNSTLSYLFNIKQDILQSEVIDNQKLDIAIININNKISELGSHFEFTSKVEQQIIDVLSCYYCIARDFSDKSNHSSDHLRSFLENCWDRQKD